MSELEAEEVALTGGRVSPALPGREAGSLTLGGGVPGRSETSLLERVQLVHSEMFH